MTEKSLIDEQLEQITLNYQCIQDRIAQAIQLSGRKENDVRFMAVTKTVNPVLINHALSLGVGLIGENKVQELLSKKEFINSENVEKHLIGHLQSNKVKKIIGEVSMIESVDSNDIAAEISKVSEKMGIVTDVLIEVNIAGEEAKTGVLPCDVCDGIAFAETLPGIRVRGLMSVPPVCEDSNSVMKYFSEVRELYEKYKKSTWDTLSLGMSGDYYEAIMCGSTLIRVGSALFGNRRY